MVLGSGLACLGARLEAHPPAYVVRSRVSTRVFLNLVGGGGVVCLGAVLHMLIIAEPRGVIEETAKHSNLHDGARRANYGISTVIQLP